eukprot:TRINITY_DN3652_c0_g1_i1.p1 TRINITY_DN3652_c0_g1~~TRINITY_DN3652_c0_g1_i1.p1  ORF type:complete len:603 (+),score=143.57 TRINITY_DN3652_c0_g1_i1:125-1933(+)
MLEHFVIFTKSGFVLWQNTSAVLIGNPVNELIKTVLLEERAGLDSFSYEGKYTLKWTQANDCNLVFVAVYQKILHASLSYIDDLLDETKKAFISIYGSDIKPFQNYSFDKQFEALLKEVQSRCQKSKDKKPSTYEEREENKKLKNAGKGKETAKNKAKDKLEQPEPTSEVTETTAQGVVPPTLSVLSSGFKIPKFRPVSNVPAGTKHVKKVRRTKKEDTPEPAPGTRRTKVARKWDCEEDVGTLDFSVKSSETDQVLPNADLGIGEKVILDPSSESSSSSDEDEPQQAASTPQKSGLLKYFSNFINRELTEKDLEPVMLQISNHLITKNVAAEISEKLCASVTQNLIGKHLGTFERVYTAVREAMETALVRILTPKRQIDVLREARAAREKNRPYVIVFAGVNGVGKSTSLAKVCSWLLQNELSVMIAACDTFRAGAVEQLQVHAKNLGVNVFHRGYGKDPAGVAAEGINKARKEKTDVVLIDTAGRMQDNELLMRALAKLVGVNEPDLVLFVGEALVGNEAVDQLTKFNRSLEEYGTGSIPRGIDGIVLTKFDTVDEKVGAAISMVYTTGQPIVFVGVGQKYSDLRQLNVQRIVSVLLKGH